jgi:aminopeptidase
MGSLDEGARNAVLVCMGVKESERVLIVSDEANKEIGEALKRNAEPVSGALNVQLLILEDIDKRPLHVLPQKIKDAIPTSSVTFWAAESQRGELVARQEFLALARKYARHAHMPGVTKKIMEQGMCADYDEVYSLTHKVTAHVERASEIKLSNKKGLDLLVEFERSWRWKPCDGRYHRKGDWGNLPEGETFTAPRKVNGRIVTNLLGDWFSNKYGNFSETLSFEVKDSRIDLDSLESENNALLSDAKTYLQTEENSNRAGEFALPSNPLLMSQPTIGVLLQDEKARPHIAFGDPYSYETGAPWKCGTHVDMLLEECDATVDGTTRIMERGRYLI